MKVVFNNSNQGRVLVAKHGGGGACDAASARIAGAHRCSAEPRKETEMRNVSRAAIIANFEELLAEDQIQTAVDLLVVAEPDQELVLIEQTSPALLEDPFQALSADERAELTGQLSAPARARLAEVLLGEGAAPGAMDESQLIARYQQTRDGALEPTDALASPTARISPLSRATCPR